MGITDFCLTLTREGERYTLTFETLLQVVGMGRYAHAREEAYKDMLNELLDLVFADTACKKATMV